MVAGVSNEGTDIKIFEVVRKRSGDCRNREQVPSQIAEVGTKLKRLE